MRFSVFEGLAAGTALAIATGAGLTVYADCEPNLVAKLVPSDGAPGDLFGISVAIDGNRAVAGAYYDDDAGENTGSAYVFEYDCTSWVLAAKLVASDARPSDSFGQSVGISGDRIMISAPGVDGNSLDLGAAYIFEFEDSSWVEEQKLFASGGNVQDFLGYRVGISGNRAVVSSRLAEGTGAVYVFAFDGASWIETEGLTASDGEWADHFGEGLAIHGDRIVVGTPLDDRSGSTYVYDYDGTSWLETKIIPSDGTGLDHFGVSCDVHGDRLVVGAPLASALGQASGQAYIFEYDGNLWQETQLLPSDGQEHDEFGIGVAIQDEVAVVGAWNDDDNGSNSGAAYIFQRNGSVWSEVAKLTASDAVANDRFGRTVAISNDKAIIGAHWKNEHGFRSGAAYVFDLNCLPSVCGNGIIESGEYCDDCNTSDGDCCSSTCSYEPAGAVCGEGPSECSAQDSCDGAGACLPNHLDPGLPCGNPPGECYSGDSCSGDGFCITGSMVTECISGDGCCPDECSYLEDDDCIVGVPTVSSWGSIGLALLLLSVGKVHELRKRNSAA